MANISELELQNVRHLLLHNETDEKKYRDYAENATDQHIKQFFEKSAQSAKQNKEKLLQFLQ